MRGDRDLALSPDGRHLAFIRMAMIGVSEVYVQDLAGGAARKLTDDGVEVAGLAWSPTGKSVFFSSNRSGDFGVWSVSRGGGEPARLGSGLREVRRLATGADGTLAMELMDVRANLAEVGGKIITDEAGVQWAGDVSPSGVLAFIADTRAGRAVWTRAPGQPAQKLTFFQATHMDDVRWSPDGRRLAFVAARHGRYGVYEIAAGGGQPRLLLSGDYEISSLSWEADGKTLVLAAKRGGTPRLWRLDTGKPGELSPITGPGWVAVRATPVGLLAMKQEVPGIWTLNRDGTQAVRLSDSPAKASNAWTVRGDRQFWIDWPRDGASVVMTASTGGGPVSVVAKAPDATDYSGLAIDPATGAMIYTRQVHMDIDVGLMRLQRGG
jgi:dipeptidyl aminopeptidase/acylaminoacyl peptidase